MRFQLKTTILTTTIKHTIFPNPFILHQYREECFHSAPISPLLLTSEASYTMPADCFWKYINPIPPPPPIRAAQNEFFISATAAFFQCAQCTCSPCAHSSILLNQKLHVQADNNGHLDEPKRRERVTDGPTTSIKYMKCNVHGIEHTPVTSIWHCIFMRKKPGTQARQRKMCVSWRYEVKICTDFVILINESVHVQDQEKYK